MIDPEMRKDCPMRGHLGNCYPVGGFCIDAVSDEICEAVHNAYAHGFCNALKMLKEQYSCENCAIAIEDRQLVVRCKDCKYGYMLPNSSDYVYCTKPYSGMISHKPDWFCADGDRR